MPAQLQAGDHVRSEQADFELCALIGRGAFGEVWKCKDRDSREFRAVKVVRGRHDEGCAAHEMKMMEIAYEANGEAWQGAPTRRVPQVFFSSRCFIEGAGGEDKGQALGLVTEFIDGGTLAQILERGPVDAAAGVPVIFDVLRALVGVTAHGMIHRDIKPANIKINRAGNCYLSDWGCACIWRLGEPQDIVGTPMYMAPEMVRSTPTRYSCEVDTWSLAMVAYEMMVGHTPWRVGGVNLSNDQIVKRLRAITDMDEFTKDFAAEGGANGPGADFAWLITEGLKVEPGPTQQIRPTPCELIGPSHRVFTHAVASARLALAALLPGP
mmetsp:Transcript_102802/g.296000  ORF Transcript_102802/g.296000 Transcript_102802/m.296000 type:complete len:325 (-) Transcript_102802:91-1065(-)